MKHRPKVRSKSPQPGPTRGQEETAPPATIPLLALVLLSAALITSVYLAFQALTGSGVAGCSAGSSCDQVLSSRWSSILGIPVSVFGAGLYAFLITGMFRKSESNPQLQAITGALVLSGAVWFTLVQAFILKTFCPWCCTTHALASLGVVSLWVHNASGTKTSPIFGFATAAPMIAVFALIQAVSPHPENIKRLSLANNNSNPATATIEHPSFDPKELPQVGADSATVSGVAITDFTCPHCRDLHKTLESVEARGTNDFAVTFLPGYHEQPARELHKTLLTLWRIDQPEYERITAAIINESIPANEQSVMAQLSPNMKTQFYRLAWEQSDWVHQTLTTGKHIMAQNEQRLGITTLPQLMIGKEIVAGPPQVETIMEMATAAEPGLPEIYGSKLAQTLSEPTAPPTGTTNSVIPTPAPGGSPKIQFIKNSIEMGKVTKGTTATATFEYKNVGDAPLQLTALKPGCSCTKVDGWQQMIAPGQTGSFKVNLDTERFDGKVSRAITYETNGKKEKGTLYIHADVWTPIKVSPSAVTFGSILKGSKIEPKSFIISTTDDEKLTIGEITGGKSYFATKVSTIEEGRRYKVEVSIPELGDVMRREHLTIPLGHKSVPSVKVQAYVNPVAPVVARPEHLVKSAIISQTAEISRLTAQCYDPAITNFNLLEPAYTGSAEVKVTVDASAGYRLNGNTLRILKIEFPPGYDAVAAQKENAQVTFKSNHPDYPAFKVPIKVIGQR